MFTGIVEEVGTVVSIEDRDDSKRFIFGCQQVTSDASLGDSIACNGVCLTVVAHDGSSFAVDVMQESLRHSALGELQPGSSVNFERAMAANGRLGGHIVQGHVDGTAQLLSRAEHPQWHVLRFSLPEHLTKYVVYKGSITVSGTSLTVSGLSSDEEKSAWFEVSLIPATLQHTILGELAVGESINLEVDVIAKYVERLLGSTPGH